MNQNRVIVRGETIKISPEAKLSAATTAAKRWSIPHRDKPAEEVLIRELGIPRIVASVLVNRGYRDPQVAHRFLNPSLEDFHDPRLLPDFQPAVAAVMGAKERGEKVFVHGDYDVDGISSAALLTRFLRKLGFDVIPFVPHRMRDGYGVSRIGLETAHKDGAKLMITCDCGTSSHDEIAYAKELGMKVVVTDHHELGDGLPNADAIVNPHRGGYPFDMLCGAGVAFKFCAGIATEAGLDPNHFYRAYLDLAVLGTVSDIVPLEDENRIITRFGLRQLAQSKKVGLRKLLATSDCEKYRMNLNAGHIGFRIGPRINSAGRMDDAGDALRLLLTESDSEANDLAHKLESLNETRQSEERRAFDNAVDQVMEQRYYEDTVIVISSSDWQRGLIGLVAGKLKERFSRPTVVIALDGEGFGHGSARSISAFDLKKSFDDLRELLVRGGGHKMAGGLTIEESNVDEFRLKMNEYANKILSPDDLVPEVAVEVEVEARDADLGAAIALEQIEPCGAGNSTPVFLTRKMRVLECSETRSGGHWQVKLRSEAGDFRRGIGFGMAADMASVLPGTEVDIAYTIAVEEYNGDRMLKWIIKDAKPSVA